MTRADSVDAGAVGTFARTATELLGTAPNEEVLKQNFLTHLPTMFPTRPAWIARHTRGAEAQTAYGDADRTRSAFIDNLVGYTSIEWEHDLRKKSIFDTGYFQVRQHAAGLINSGAPVEQVIGVLSDTVRWYAYRVGSFSTPADGSPLGPDDIQLEEIGRVDVTLNTAHEHTALAEFLARYLGREGSQALTADMVAFDLGIRSEFCKRHMASLSELVTSAMNDRPDYAGIIENLWLDFVAYLGDGQVAGPFSVDVYTAEFYMVTLAKLICANVVAHDGLHSDDTELRGILGGNYFKARGLLNLVEYDYFGWLNAEPHVDALIPIARDMQADLRAYDFVTTPEEDVFGQMLAELAGRLQRLLLGQEWTPTWLARQMARELVGALAPGEAPRFVDMCCGSGSMLVQTLHAWRARLRTDGRAGGLASDLAQVATGFDIDPLAVMLAKVNWVIAARDELRLDEAHPVSIPVYLADSMWAKTPIGVVGTVGAEKAYPLMLHDQPLELPEFLVRPESRPLFDALLDHAYTLGLAHARSGATTGRGQDLRLALDEACEDASHDLISVELAATERFFDELVGALATLQRKGLNGIWAFVLRNSYRPGLMVGQFNGLISNPPWLALSKISSNPYRETLRTEAETYGVKPSGASHLHIELATTFLLHATDYYLRGGALIGCILPDAVLNGHQHTPFRRREYAHATRSVDLVVSELWRVETGTFKNEAVVLIGRRDGTKTPENIPGYTVGMTDRTPLEFRAITLGDRVVWSDRPDAEAGMWFGDIAFRQGADIMPRRAVFHEVTAVGRDRWRIASIDASRSPLGYLVSEGKKLTDFRLTPTVVPARYLFPVLLSKHVVPFVVGEPAVGFLPIERSESDGKWHAVSAGRLAATPSAAAAFEEILAAHGDGFSLSDYFEALDSQRKKLSAQQFPDGGYLVLYGAGGSSPCAAYVDLNDLEARRLVVDQTLYWRLVEDEDEALYLTGLFNSDALEELIREYQPRGQFGRRHVHELPGRVTPGFDPTQAVHAAVVDATRALIEDLSSSLASDQYAAFLDPARSLPWRRRSIRREVLPNCQTFAVYDRACRDLYGLP
ncbi:MAG TPA: N-6 DNA methylase [Solirubrobacteraceae bacterium]|nr:N-6 DNA methylase [Solirubrobacteraceae bacterium]